VTDPLVDERATAMMHSAMPFTATLGIEVLHSEAEEVQSRLLWHESLTTSGGLLHGGALMALADATGGLCAFLNLPEGAGTSTIESKTNFLRAVRGGAVVATARPLHTGRRVVVVETEIHDESGRLAAKVTQTQAVLTPSG
jgi:uncharacterized protein (TIGR00369 family)